MEPTTTAKLAVSFSKYASYIYVNKTDIWVDRTECWNDKENVSLDFNTAGKLVGIEVLGRYPELTLTDLRDILTENGVVIGC